MTNEAELLAGLRARNPRALAQLYALHRAALYGFLVRLGAEPALASDLAQETWLRLAANAHRLTPESEPRAWLFTVARNLYRSHVRWRVFSQRRTTELDAPVAHPNPELREQIQRVERALASLPTRYREVLLLIAVEGFAPEQVARMLELSPTALRKRLSRARALLREQVEES